MKDLKPILIIVMLYTILLSGCTTENEIELITGTCKVDVKGYLNKSFYGKAVFDNIPTGRGYSIFFLQLIDTKILGVNYHYVEISGSKPGPGTHGILNGESENNNSNGMYAYYNDSEIHEYFKTTNGLLVVNWANDELMKGWLEFTAYTNITLTSGEIKREEIKICAIFYAQKGNTGIIIN